MHAQPELTTVRPLFLRLVLSLDIDGIFHSTTISDQLEALVPGEQAERRVAFVKGKLQPKDFGMLVPAKQALLVKVLQRHPNVVLVISSAWRNWQGFVFWDTAEPEDPLWEQEHVESLTWLKSLLHPVLAERIIGKTPLLFHESSGRVNFRATRLDEIRAFMRAHGQAEGLAPNWVAIDDQARHFADLDIGVFEDVAAIRSHAGTFPAEAVLLVDGLTGLTEASAEALDAALRRASAGLHLALAT